MEDVWDGRNLAALAGVVSAGGGFIDLTKLMGALNIRCMGIKIMKNISCQGQCMGRSGTARNEACNGRGISQLNSVAT